MYIEIGILRLSQVICYVCRGEFPGVLAVMHSCSSHTLRSQWDSKVVACWSWTCRIMVWWTEQSKDIIMITVGPMFNDKQAVMYANLETYQFLQEKIISCYQLMQEITVDNNRRKPPKLLPQLRVTIRARVRSSGSSSSSSSSSYKRRKINNCLWVDDDKGNGD